MLFRPSIPRAGVSMTCLLVSLLAPMPAVGVGADPDHRPCRAGEGVTVVVDFASTDGDRVVVGCAEGEQRNGFAALRNAGFTSTRVDVQPGAVCSIEGHPADDDDACWWSGYWAYWRSNGMQSWRYSSVGAGGVGPIAVDRVEGWRFTLIDDPKAKPRQKIGDLPSFDAARIGTGPVARHHSVYGAKRPSLAVTVRSGPDVTGRVSLFEGDRLLRRVRLVDESAVLRWPSRALERGRHRLTVRYLGSAAVEAARTGLVWKVRSPGAAR